MSSDIAIDIRGVTKRFADRTIFHNLSLQVRSGEVVAIIGPSGTGKSTLIRCINQLTPFEAGSIHVLDHELTGSSRPSRVPISRRSAQRRLRAEVGMVFQTFNLFPHLTVLDNITLAPMRVLRLSPDQARARADALLDKVGLTARANAYPRRLSGGEQQRVAIARALAMEPKIMLFDEPTSMLDPELVGEVLDTIGSLAHTGMTIMLVTHEIEFAREVADTVAVMADGQLAEIGPAAQVLTSPRSERSRSFLSRVLRYHSAGAGTAGSRSAVS
ncbi:amino acid ABC transporter ATP-binding protein [Amycolatopsis pithecellobii]|uniref:ATP-binding cassette domain-containing protein n=1 Tax=Amycolatopsis pithecellobii TaxID=664692 RepID=A0A6N7YMQ9_9PSEU|nr:amino acid ABC transporter ATP-binding protein [Amycolatopsis pithecellobii]MTD54267.1 ATP-binding cassette domain-containing protein [Amycolatopsis pithecellobii]